MLSLVRFAAPRRRKRDASGSLESGGKPGRQSRARAGRLQHPREGSEGPSRAGGGPAAAMTVSRRELLRSAEPAGALSNLGARSWATARGGENGGVTRRFPAPARAPLSSAPALPRCCYGSLLPPPAPGSFLRSAASFSQALPVSAPPTCVPLGTAHLEDHGD